MGKKIFDHRAAKKKGYRSRGARQAKGVQHTFVTEKAYILIVLYNVRQPWVLF